MQVTDTIYKPAAAASGNLLIIGLISTQSVAHYHNNVYRWKYSILTTSKLFSVSTEKIKLLF